ncbi:glycosyltransferase family 9 protein [Nitrospirillum sp. BR 11163]|uniref:glycosyltransferase family 9 protein n=1 Tax=Nitrospirillum sp. BR 11163 TaxID=3104323 RepID=UPI003A4C830A
MRRRRMTSAWRSIRACASACAGPATPATPATAAVPSRRRCWPPCWARLAPASSPCRRGEGAALGLVDWTADFADMANTAALVQGLDLVISVDSAVAHLAGALGRPVWLLNRFDSCWRWLEAGTEANPWYPTLTEFRQPTAGDWDTVMTAVTTKLAETVTAQGGRKRQAGKR